MEVEAENRHSPSRQSKNFDEKEFFRKSERGMRERQIGEMVSWPPPGLEEVEEAGRGTAFARPRGQAGPSHTLNWEYRRLRQHTHVRHANYNHDSEGFLT